MAQYRIMHYEGFGFLPQLQDHIGWQAISKNVTVSVYDMRALNWPNLFHETEKSAGELINKHVALSNAKPIWRAKA